ncbi:MAG: sterol desaturase family protein [Microscillaceae bacterium]|jgi:sterol desaturase/sphingolipid hydroxylase (fatty acid hydroxylase superfamily)|nr:sterol desaturase family protein [Microscillaceae bacterium]
MDFDPLALAVPVFLGMILLEIVIDTWGGRKVYSLQNALSNVACGILVQIGGVFLKVLEIGVYQYVFQYYAIFEIGRTWFSFFGLLILTDFCFYWYHRASHTVGFFWGAHVVHHQSEDYNLTVNLRQNIIHHAVDFPFYLPLAFLGFSTEQFIYTFAFISIYQFWLHTEYIGKLGILDHIFNTPSNHRVHHGRNPRYIDKNLSAFLVIWDKLFGTFQAEDEAVVYGITSPLKSGNPLWADWQYFGEMGRLFRQIPRWQDKWKVLYKPPGWRPAELGGSLAVPAVDVHTYQKYRLPSFAALNVYITFQFIFTMLIGSVSMAYTAYLSLSWQLINSALVIWAVVNCTTLFTQKKSIFYSEYSRLGVSVVVVMVQLWSLSHFEVYVSLLAVWGLGSLLAVFQLFKKVGF